MEGLDLLRDAADVLGRLDPDVLSDGELGAVLVEWQRLDARLAAARARLTAAFDRRGVWRADGAKSAAGWLARETNGSVGEMRAQTRLARRLGHMPATRAALAAGEISARHAQILARLADSPRPPVAQSFPDAEAQLVGYARTLTFDEFVIAARYWESVVDEDGLEDQAGADRAARHVELAKGLRGNWFLDGQLDPAAGTEIAAELDRLQRQLFDTDWAEAKAVHGETTCRQHLARTDRQRRADALRLMAQRSRSTPADAQPPRPLLVVHLGDKTLERLCELASGTVIAPGLLVPLLGEAELERIVYAGPSRRVVDLGRRSRFFTGALRRAIQLRDRRCTEGGCNVPADDCHVDHTIPWAKQGRTDQNNGSAKCRHHNHHKADTLDPHLIDHDHPTEPGWHHTDPDNLTTDTRYTDHPTEPRWHHTDTDDSRYADHPTEPRWHHTDPDDSRYADDRRYPASAAGAMTWHPDTPGDSRYADSRSNNHSSTEHLPAGPREPEDAGYHGGSVGEQPATGAGTKRTPTDILAVR